VRLRRSISCLGARPPGRIILLHPASKFCTRWAAVDRAHVRQQQYWQSILLNSVVRKSHQLMLVPVLPVPYLVAAGPMRICCQGTPPSCFRSSSSSTQPSQQHAIQRLGNASYDEVCTAIKLGSMHLSLVRPPLMVFVDRKTVEHGRSVGYRPRGDHLGTK
jgi:hypothetical protein